MTDPTDDPATDGAEPPNDADHEPDDAVHLSGGAGDSPDDAGDSSGDAGDQTGETDDTPSVSPAALQDRIDRRDPVRVLDLRNRDEVERWRIDGPSVAFTQKPNNRFVQARVTDSVDEFVDDVAGDGPITAVCARGEASADVASSLVDRGYEARNLAGGMEAWSDLYVATELDVDWGGSDRSGASDTAPTVVQYRRPSSGCLAYMVCSDGDAVVVDPLRAFTDRYVADAAARDATIVAVVDTHVHADHVSGLRSLAAAADARAVMPAAAVDRGVTFEVDAVADGDEIRAGDAVLTAVRAPGHTTGMTAFAVRGAGEGNADGDHANGSHADEAAVLLTGDSLFLEGVARPDLERGADGARDLARELHRTLTERFDRFADDVLAAPGHHGTGTPPADDGTYAARLGDLRTLPALALTPEEFVDYVVGDAPPRPANFERVIAVNLGREAVGDEAAFELELGPNNCAATPAADD